MPILTLQLFGSPQIIYDEDWLDLRSVKTQALLFYLAVTQRSHSRLALGGLLWPEKNDSEARTNLRQAIYHLNLAIPDCILASRDSLKLNPRLTVNLDVLRFEKQATLGLKTDHTEERYNALHTAVMLYQGDFLAGFFISDAAPYEDWMQGVRERQSNLAFGALRWLTNQAIAQSQSFEGLRYAEQLVVLDPLNEDSHYQLMQLLTMNGQTKAALTHFEQCRLLFAEELGITPDEKLSRLADDIRRGVVGQPATVTPIPLPEPATSTRLGDQNQETPLHNLSTSLSSFVGRQREVAMLQAVLLEPGQRLVSLLGVGGVGKTRLANYMGSLLLPQFEDGVWFVDLLAAGDEDLVEQAVVSALGIHEKSQSTRAESLVDNLAGRQILLLFDNCEHVIAAAARLIERLLQAAPRLKILATSREPLNLPGEYCFAVSPLPLPNMKDLQSAQQILTFESVQLFIQRASLTAVSVVLNEANARSIAKICQMLDGIPLAIELVAARTRTLSVVQIAHQLADIPGARFQLTSRGRRNAHNRHKTLHNSIAWSYTLLEDGERTLFERLAVFAGSWSLAAAQEICADVPAVAANERTNDADHHPSLAISVQDGLSSLVDKSLIIAEAVGDEMRYRFLETIQRFALDKLVESGAESRLRDLHLAYFVRYMGKWEVPPEGMSRAAWQSLIQPDLDNIRSALNWSMQGGAASEGLRLAQVTGEYWFSQGLHSESIRWIESLLAMPEATKEKALRLALLSAMEFTQWWVLGNYARARELQLEALALAEALGDTQRVEKTLNNLAGVALHTGDYEAADCYLQRSLQLTEQSGNLLNRSWSLILLGEATLAQHQYEAAKPCFEQAVCLLRSLNSLSLLAYPVRRLGQIAFLQRQDIPTALRHYRESLELNLAAGEIEGKAACVAAYAQISRHRNAVDLTIQLCAAVAAALEISQSRLPAYDVQAFEDLLSTLRSHDIPDFEMKWQAGKRLSLSQAIALIESWLTAVHNA